MNKTTNEQNNNQDNDRKNFLDKIHVNVQLLNQEELKSFISYAAKLKIQRVQQEFSSPQYIIH